MEQEKMLFQFEQSVLHETAMYVPRETFIPFVFYGKGVKLAEWFWLVVAETKNAQEDLDTYCICREAGNRPDGHQVILFRCLTK